MIEMKYHLKNQIHHLKFQEKVQEVKMIRENHQDLKRKVKINQHLVKDQIDKTQERKEILEPFM